MDASSSSRPGLVPPLSLPTADGPTGWLYEAILIYDGDDGDVKRRVQRIANNLTDNGVRTCMDLNPSGSLKGSKALSMSTTTAALVSAGTAVVFVSRNLLKKAAGKGWHGEDDACAIEVSLALKHAQHVVVVLTDESVHEVVGWPGKTGEKLAKLARGPKPAIDIVNDGASAATNEEDYEEACQLSAWKIYYEIRDKAGKVPGNLGPSLLNEAAGTPRVQDAATAKPLHVEPSRSPARMALRERGKMNLHIPAFNHRDNKSVPDDAKGGEAAGGSAFSGRDLTDLTCDEVVRLLAHLGYGKYAISFRTSSIDGKKLAGMSVFDLGGHQIVGEGPRKRLHAAIQKYVKRGVPAEHTKGSTLSVMWQALRGGYSEPYTPEEKFEQIVSARQQREKESLTPRSNGLLSLTPRQARELREEEVRNAYIPTAFEIMYGAPTHSNTPYAVGVMGSARGIPPSIMMKIAEDHNTPRPMPPPEEAAKEIGSYSLH